MEKNKNKILRYFRNEIWLPILGAAIVLLGFLLLRNRQLRELRVLATPIMVIGALLIALYFFRRVSDADYRDYFRAQLGTLPQPKLDGRDPDLVYEEFNFEGTRFRRADREQKLCTECFVRTEFFFDPDRMTVACCTVNAADATAERREYSFVNGHTHATLTNLEIRFGGSLKHSAMMELTGEDGISCRFPVESNSVDVEALVRRINGEA